MISQQTSNLTSDLPLRRPKLSVVLLGALIAILAMLWAMVAGQVTTNLFGIYIAPENLILLRWGLVLLYAAVFSLLLLVLLQIFRRGNQLLTGRAISLQRQQVATERGLVAQAPVSADIAINEPLNELQTSYRNTLRALSTALDARDRETEGHSRRVAAFASVLAKALGVQDPKTLETLEWGALLHDVGKIGVSDAILHKPGTLTVNEWVAMRQHSEIGRQILAHIPFLQQALSVVVYHHERWDGSGYPYGLRQKDIPLVARIFAVVDAMDAITSTRPYRSAQSFAQAREEILLHRGTQFDPAIVDTFLKIPETSWACVAEHVDSESTVPVPDLSACRNAS